MCPEVEFPSTHSAGASAVPPTHSVISGQQVGLLGGPLFVIYKILGVYHLAAHSQSFSKEKTLQPIYWLEGNDADFNEIATFSFLDKQGHLRKSTWSTPSHGKPIGELLVDQALIDLYQEFFSNIPPTKHSQEVQELVFNSYQLGNPLKEANRFFYQNLFSPLEKELKELGNHLKMRWFDPSEKDFRNFSQSLLRQEIENTPIDEQCPVFGLIRGRREALFKKKDYCLTRNGLPINWQEEILLPSLKNRSLLQDAYHQSLYYIAGPAEKIYLADLIPRYQDYGIQPAQVMERMSLTITDSEVEKDLEQLKLGMEDFLNNSFTDLVRRLQNQLQGVDFYQSKKVMKKIKDDLMKNISSFSSISTLPIETKKEIFKEMEKNIYQEIKHLLGRRRKTFKEEHQSILNLLLKNSQFLSPRISSNLNKQERVYNVASFLNRYGIKMISDIYHQYAFESKIISLDL